MRFGGCRRGHTHQMIKPPSSCVAASQAKRNPRNPKRKVYLDISESFEKEVEKRRTTKATGSKSVDNDTFQHMLKGVTKGKLHSIENGL